MTPEHVKRGNCATRCALVEPSDHRRTARLGSARMRGSRGIVDGLHTNYRARRSRCTHFDDFPPTPHASSITAPPLLLRQSNIAETGRWSVSCSTG